MLDDDEYFGRNFDLFEIEETKSILLDKTESRNEVYLYSNNL